MLCIYYFCDALWRCCFALRMFLSMSLGMQNSSNRDPALQAGRRNYGSSVLVLLTLLLDVTVLPCYRTGNVGARGVASSGRRRNLSYGGTKALRCVFPAVSFAAGSGGEFRCYARPRQDGGGDWGRLVFAARAAEPGRAAGVTGPRLRPHDPGAGEGAALRTGSPGKEAPGRGWELALRSLFLTVPPLGKLGGNSGGSRG